MSFESFKLFFLIFSVATALPTSDNAPQVTVKSALHSLIQSLRTITNKALEIIFRSFQNETVVMKESLNAILQRLDAEDVGITSPPPLKPTNCAELYKNGHKTSGVYTIYPKLKYEIPSVKVYCDMETDGGGWMVFQRRGEFDVVENFYRNWADYENGFGDFEKEFWLGNFYISALSNQDSVNLRVNIESYDGAKVYAQYDNFRMSSKNEKFKLTVDGYAGSAGDSLKLHNGSEFYTWQRWMVVPVLLFFQFEWHKRKKCS